MPLNCPKKRLPYNACLDCHFRNDNECWANLPISQKLADILTITERVSILEDRKETPAVNIVTITKQDYQQLQRLILSLKEKLESHITQGVTSKKKKFKDYSIDNI